METRDNKTTESRNKFRDSVNHSIATIIPITPIFPIAPISFHVSGSCLPHIWPAKHGPLGLPRIT